MAIAYSFNDEQYINARSFSYEHALNIYQYHIDDLDDLNSFNILNVKTSGYSHILIDCNHCLSNYNDDLFNNESLLCSFINECHLNSIGVILSTSINNTSDTAIDNANFLIDEYHFDGLVINNVMDIIYYDELNVNVIGISYIKDFTYMFKTYHKDCLLIAKDIENEADDFGFDYKLNLNWRKDTLDYFSMDPKLRPYVYNKLTFPLTNFYQQKYILSLASDSFVVDKLWGTYNNKLAQYRNLLLYLYTFPGKKLVSYDFNNTNHFNDDLIKIYNTYKAFNSFDYYPAYFKWLINDDNENGVYSYCRYDDDYCFVVIINNNDVSLNDYEVGVPLKGTYTKLIDSQEAIYGGNSTIDLKIETVNVSANGSPYSINVDLPAFGGLIISIPINRISPSLNIPDNKKNNIIIDKDITNSFKK